MIIYKYTAESVLMYMNLPRVYMNCSKWSRIREIRRRLGRPYNREVKWESNSLCTHVYLILFWNKKCAWTQLEQD
jgi:hypothetical protein